MDRDRINKFVLLMLVLFISALFLAMIRAFLMAIFLAGLFSALTYPLYDRLQRAFRGRRSLASMTTLVLIILFVLLPLTGLAGIVTAQAIRVGNSVRPWVQRQIAEPSELFARLKALPYFDQIAPYRDLIFQKAGEAVGKISGFLISSLQSAAMDTVNFLFMTFVFLYTMYFFFMDGGKLIRKILYYLPLEERDERRMLDRFTSVAMATLKGTAVIGVLQGTLAGIAFFAAGIPSAVFWAVIMVLLSVLPGIGTALVWVPAAVILAAGGQVVKAAALFAFCAVVVGSMDNLLRPILVGKGTRMHELMIFFGTLGGILMFGFLGFIIGPIVAALFVTVWDIYGVSFADILPTTGPGTAEADPRAPEMESNEPEGKTDPDA